jgi:hypothetical protein
LFRRKEIGNERRRRRENEAIGFRLIRNCGGRKKKDIFHCKKGVQTKRGTVSSNVIGKVK